MILLMDDNAHSLQWSLGRVIGVIPGPDDVIRVADIKTAQGVYIIRSRKKIVISYT